MSASQSQSTLEAKLKDLQCHFTWDIDSDGSRLLCLKEELEDIGTEEGNSWLGHIYNLQGYIHYHLGFTEDAQHFFNKATEALRRSRKTDSDEGPWLAVNYGNLAWLHHHLGEQAESQTYLSKVDTLLKEFPSPSQDEIHPEIYAEKAWTLMKLDKDKKPLVEDYFQRAIKMQPDMVEWNTSRVIAFANAVRFEEEPVEEDLLEQMKKAIKQDPENLYLAARYLEQRGRKGERIEDEARELARKVLKNPVSSYSGIKVLLKVYQSYVSVDEAVALAEEALEKHPDERYLKKCAALCYRWRIVLTRRGHLRQSTVDRGIRLHKEVIPLYTDSLLNKITLANIYAKSNHSQREAEKIYQELLQMDLEPSEKQLICNYYAKYLNFDRRDYNRSIEYHMKAAEIPHQSYYRDSSIKSLERFKERNRSRMCGEIEELLAKLKI